MNIKDSTIHSFGGFELDTDKIGTTSTSKREIRLTYTGELPEPYDSATIFFRVTPECIAVVLRVENGKRKPAKYVLEASREEINAILCPLFWFKAADTECRSRFDNGLSEYWNGHYQAEFTAWRTIGESPTKIISIMQQLSPEKRASLYRMIDLMRSEEVAVEKRNDPRTCAGGLFLSFSGDGGRREGYPTHTPGGTSHFRAFRLSGISP